MSTARTLVALATYNEIENLPSLVEEILRVLPEADVLVVDDNSPDGTGEWCDQAAANQPRLRCIHRGGKQGLGSAALAAFGDAIKNDYETVATLDADWSHHPRYLPQLIAALDEADVAIGSRYCAGGGIEGWPWHRRAMSAALNRVSRVVLRLSVTDSSGAFRAFRVANLCQLPLDELQASGYSFLEELLWHLHRAGATFAEVPITFYERHRGKSKINFREAIGKLSMLLRLLLR